MSIEACVVVGFHHDAIFWHLPEGRSAGGIPDSNTLWDVIWKNRSKIFGIAHSHPGGGCQGPSHEDVTTFAAIEQAIGRRLVWWIVSANVTSTILWRGPGRYDYDIEGSVRDLEDEPSWVSQLRRESGWETATKEGNKP